MSAKRKPGRPRGSKDKRPRRRRRPSRRPPPPPPPPPPPEPEPEPAAEPIIEDAPVSGEPDDGAEAMPGLDVDIGASPVTPSGVDDEHQGASEARPRTEFEEKVEHARLRGRDGAVMMLASGYMGAIDRLDEFNRARGGFVLPPEVKESFLAPCALIVADRLVPRDLAVESLALSVVVAAPSVQLAQAAYLWWTTREDDKPASPPPKAVRDA